MAAEPTATRAVPRCALALALGLGSGVPARAASELRPDATVPGRHALYVEGLGKGGLYGVGYDYQIERWLAAGALASYALLDGQHVIVVSPYLGIYVCGGRRHRMLVHGGPQLTYVRTPSPVPEWPGDSSLGLAGELTVGYEYRRGLLARVAGTLVAGRGGLAPWIGASLGWAL
jgi:hypothetical protein